MRKGPETTREAVINRCSNWHENLVNILEKHFSTILPLSIPNLKKGIKLKIVSDNSPES